MLLIKTLTVVFEQRAADCGLINVVLATFFATMVA